LEISRNWDKTHKNFMEERTFLTTNISLVLADGTVSQLRQEYLGYQQLYQLQPPLVQRFLETQASSLAEAMMRDMSQISFNLPDRVNCTNLVGELKLEEVPSEYRQHTCGGFASRLTRRELRTVLHQRLTALEHSTNPAVAISTSLLHHAVVIHMVHNMLPVGKAVEYAVVEGEEIPCIPVQRMHGTKSAFTESKDEIFNEDLAEAGRGELPVPYVEAARRFYLPQWVAFDDEGHLLVGGLNEAEAHVASMQRYLSVLHAAVGLAPYMVADEEYQRKRHGILGQLVNQGRALASYEVEEIIRIIQQRGTSHELNRGLGLSLPYFDDQTLTIENYCFEVVPAGRIMFIPAFVVLAVRQQGVKVAQDTRLSRSTRKYLLSELSALEQAFLR
jgi:hypothetical protein